MGGGGVWNLGLFILMERTARLEFQGENLIILCIYPVFWQTNGYSSHHDGPPQKNVTFSFFTPKNSQTTRVLLNQGSLAVVLHAVSSLCRRRELRPSPPNLQLMGIPWMG